MATLPDTLGNTDLSHIEIILTPQKQFGLNKDCIFIWFWVAPCAVKPLI